MHGAEEEEEEDEKDVAKIRRKGSLSNIINKNSNIHKTRRQAGGLVIKTSFFESPLAWQHKPMIFLLCPLKKKKTLNTQRLWQWLWHGLLVILGFVELIRDGNILDLKRQLQYAKSGKCGSFKSRSFFLKVGKLSQTQVFFIFHMSLYIYIYIYFFLLLVQCYEKKKKNIMCVCVPGDMDVVVVSLVDNPRGSGATDCGGASPYDAGVNRKSSASFVETLVLVGSNTRVSVTRLKSFVKQSVWDMVSPGGSRACAEGDAAGAPAPFPC